MAGILNIANTQELDDLASDSELATQQVIEILLKIAAVTLVSTRVALPALCLLTASPM